LERDKLEYFLEYNRTSSVTNDIILVGVWGNHQGIEVPEVSLQLQAHSKDQFYHWQTCHHVRRRAIQSLYVVRAKRRQTERHRLELLLNEEGKKKEKEKKRKERKFDVTNF